MTMFYRAASGTLQAGKLLGRGGEGEVFTLADGTPRALKIYASPDAAREAKVKSMAAAGLVERCSGVAFPAEPAYAENGSFAGFIMPIVENGHPIHELCSPASRRREFHRADWRFLVRAAINTARVLDRVHQTGAVVGDINGAGVLVSNRAVVSLIDADSFQWISHPCRVGTPEYTAPELQGKNLNGLPRTVQHDAFGLAVLVFQLLFLGRHPHAGVPKGRDIHLLDAIGQNCFAYSRVQSVRLSPPGGTLLLTDLPLGLATLFERAFAGLGPRPLPREWIDELQDLEGAIVACQKKEGHYRSATAQGCPWCRIERIAGAPVFGSGDPAPPRKDTPTHASPIRAEAVRILNRARMEAGEGVKPGTSLILPNPSRDASEILERLGPPGEGQMGKPFLSANVKARRALDGAVEAWRNRVGAWTVARSATELAAAVAHHDTTVRNESSALQALLRDLSARQVKDELSRTLLTAAAIPGFAERSTARLAAAGIKHAADLSRPALQSVHGIGEKTIVALLLWHDLVEIAARKRIRLDSSMIADACERLREQQIAEEARQTRRISQLTIDLAAALNALSARVALPDDRLDTAVVAHQQTLVDLRHLGLCEREGQSAFAVSPQNSPPQPSPRKSNGSACPICGGTMVRRWARNGSTPGSFFLGCSAYPACNGSRPLRRQTS